MLKKNFFSYDMIWYVILWYDMVYDMIYVCMIWYDMMW